MVILIASRAADIELFIKHIVGPIHNIKSMAISANIYLFKVCSRNPRKRCEVCSKLTIKTPERRH